MKELSTQKYQLKLTNAEAAIIPEACALIMKYGKIG